MNLPLELINKILMFRGCHPTAQLIEKIDIHYRYNNIPNFFYNCDVTVDEIEKYFERTHKISKPDEFTRPIWGICSKCNFCKRVLQKDNTISHFCMSKNVEELGKKGDFCYFPKHDMHYNYGRKHSPGFQGYVGLTTYW